MHGIFVQKYENESWNGEGKTTENEKILSGIEA